MVPCLRMSQNSSELGLLYLWHTEKGPITAVLLPFVTRTKPSTVTPSTWCSRKQWLTIQGYLLNTVRIGTVLYGAIWLCVHSLNPTTILTMPTAIHYIVCYAMIYLNIYKGLPETFQFWITYMQDNTEQTFDQKLLRDSTLECDGSTTYTVY